MTDRYQLGFCCFLFVYLFVCLFVCDIFKAARFRVDVIQYLCVINCTVNLAIVLHLFNKLINHGKPGFESYVKTFTSMLKI